jgi:hypothetical protein
MFIKKGHFDGIALIGDQAQSDSQKEMTHRVIKFNSCEYLPYLPQPRPD